MASDDDKMMYADYASKNWSETIKDMSRRKRVMKAAEMNRAAGKMDEEDYKKTLELYGTPSDAEEDVKRQMRQYRKTGTMSEKYTGIDEKGQEYDGERDVLIDKKKKKK